MKKTLGILILIIIGLTVQVNAQHFAKQNTDFGTEFFPHSIKIEKITA